MGAAAGAMAEGVVWGDPEAAGGVDVGGVGADLREVAGEAVVREDRVDEEGVGVAEDPQLAPESVRAFDGRYDVRRQRRRCHAARDLFDRLSLRVQLAHHCVLFETECNNFIKK